MHDINRERSIEEPLIDVPALTEAAERKDPEVLTQLQRRLDKAFGEGIATVSGYEFVPSDRVIIVKFALGGTRSGSIVWST